MNLCKQRKKKRGVGLTLVELKREIKNLGGRGYSKLGRDLLCDMLFDLKSNDKKSNKKSECDNMTVLKLKQKIKGSGGKGYSRLTRAALLERCYKLPTDSKTTNNMKNPDCDNMTVLKLKQKIKGSGGKGYSRLTRNELLERCYKLPFANDSLFFSDPLYASALSDYKKMQKAYTIYVDTNKKYKDFKTNGEMSGSIYSSSIRRNRLRMSALTRKKQHNYLVLRKKAQASATLARKKMLQDTIPVKDVANLIGEYL